MFKGNNKKDLLFGLYIVKLVLLYPAELLCNFITIIRGKVKEFIRLLTRLPENYQRFVKPNANIKILLTILLLLNNIYGNSQIKFDYLSTKDGLSSNRIRCIYRDSKDYLWVGTETGLDKYDSYTVKTYRNNEKQAGTLSSNNITGFIEDSNNNLWIASTNGLNLYLPESDSFMVFRNNPADIHSIDDNWIFSFLKDSKGDLWITTYGMYLNKWNPTTQQFIRYQIETEPGPSFLEEDSKGNLWLVAETLPGIYRFYPKTGEFINYLDTTIDLGKITKSLYIDKDDKFWVIRHNKGLLSFDPSTGELKQFNTNSNGTGTNGKLINRIIEVDNQHLWIGIDQGGINIFDKVSGTFKYILHDDNSDGLGNNGIWELYKDKEGIIWVGTSGAGIDIYNQKKEKFKLYRHNVNNPNSVSSNIIGCFHEDSQGKIWIGSDDNGLNVLNPQTGNFKHFKHDPANPNSISSNTIRCITEDKNKDLWIGTWNRGLNHFNRKTGRFNCYMPDETDPTSLSGPTVWHHIIDHRGIFWLAIHNVGVDLFDKNKGVVKRFVPDPDDSTALSDAKVWYIFEDSSRNIWLCTNNGLDLYDSVNDAFIVYDDLPSNNVKAITEDNDKNLWLGTEKGICQIKADGTILQMYDESDGLAGNIIHGIVCDNDGNIWVSTNNGVSKFDPQTKEFRNFTNEDGLQDNAFFQESFLITRAGEIYFGGFKGFNAFFPDNLKVNTTIPPVYITEFQIFNKPVPFGVKGSPLQKHISETKKITLTYLQSVFSFGFTAINYTNSEKNKYAYKMEGFEKDWNYTDATRRYVTYTNLNPGEYTFRVKASNNDGIWNEEGTSISIIITPPFWETWWFRILVICIILISLISFFHYRTNKIREQKELLRKMVKERTFQLEEQQEKIYIQNEELQSQKEILQEIINKLEEQSEEIEVQNNELNQHRNHLENLVKERTADLVTAMKKAEESSRLKSAFLSNMSHEIRTPMNAIIGFSSLLSDPDLPNIEKEELISYIKKNSETLLVLIDDILEMSRIQANQLIINNKTINVIEIIKELFASFQLQSQPKGIELITDTGEFGDTLICSIDPIRLKQVLSNLINNAIKFTQKGSVKFGITIQDKDFLTFYVKDSGIGIPKEAGESIFLRFLKIDSIKNQLFEGVGLGLSISRSLVKAMGGNIWYESTLGQGTSFYFTIPYNNSNNHIEPIESQNKPEYKIPNLENKKILIVEDDETNYKLLVFYLTKTKASIAWAQNGQEAVNMVEANNFDLILMNMKLPVMDGIEATMRIRQIKPKQIIVAQTGFAFKDNKAEYLKCEFHSFIQNPIVKEKLMEILNKIFFP